MRVIDQSTCRDFSRSSRVEWLETNGAGGYAMGTVAGVNTRRYHGLLVASLRPPVDRHVLLSRLEETVLPDVALGASQYPGVVTPQGFARLVEFRREPCPQWTYDIGGGQLEKRLFLVPGEQTVAVQYRATRACSLSIAPFLAFRDHHALTRANSALDGTVREERTPDALVLRIRPYAPLPELSLHASPQARFARDGCWYFNHEYLLELERGLEFREDLWKMGTLTLDLDAGKPVVLAATIEKKTFFSQPPARARGLDRAADQFVVRRADGTPTLIAGYPWFTDWGRDTMISLPGIWLTRGRLDDAREVIRGFLAHLDGGLIPNRFPDSGEKPEYNTVDATLWMFHAVHAYLEAGGDQAFLRDEFYPAGKEIVDWHLRGTKHGIRVDPADRLLAAGEPGVQLTWMDARVDGQVITPRQGKPVEINALWHNALRLMSQWGQALGDEAAAARCAVEAQMVAGSFSRNFWNRERGCLFDVVGPNDASVRPNQLFALSLPFPLLNAEQRKSVVRVVEEKLLTPYGLRTLAPDDPAYIGRYAGNPRQRDHAYHQGTVWPWLLGPYVRAYLAAFGRTEETVRHCRDLLRPLEQHMDEACLGTIAEVFDGDAPHRAGGAPAQAWSVAELAQLLHELGACLPACCKPPVRNPP